jgi:hypothetical protein
VEEGSVYRKRQKGTTQLHLIYLRVLLPLLLLLWGLHGLHLLEKPDEERRALWYLLGFRNSRFGLIVRTGEEI